MLEHAARFVGDATVRGTLYDLGAYPGLLVAGEHAGLVTGEVYALDPAREDATLAVLDEYEGCAPRDAPPHEYRRERVQVTLVDGSTPPDADIEPPDADTAIYGGVFPDPRKRAVV